MKRWVYVSLAGLVFMLIIPVVLHEQIQRTVLQLVNSYPVSLVINKLQEANIPANDTACLKELGKRDVRFWRQAMFSVAFIEI